MYIGYTEMIEYYKRRNIFTQHDMKLLTNRSIRQGEAFMHYIVEPKMHLGRLNYGDYIRIASVVIW